jgi:NADH-quinone oxidoreductase subunit L
MIQLIWLVPLLPLIGFILIGLLNRRLSKGVAGVIGAGAVFGAFVISLLIFLQIKSDPSAVATIDLFDWISAGNLHISFSFLVDQLSSLFLLIITGVGFLIHVYSIGYMHDDEGFRRFFAYLNLFVFFMLLLVLGSNYLIMFVGWEGVGLCSYLLIGYWFKNTSYNNAAKKAFIMNRIGDLGFLLGIILIFTTFGSISYKEVFDTASSFSSGQPVMVCITLLLFIGAIGKSAQLPLYTWLPDAMAGPTPVSALIHAATMVTAGIYMIARSNILYVLAPVSMEVVAITGLVTALFAATIGLAQNDIKKVLAYSTVSQLGYMFLGLGVGAFTGAVFHVMTHAFFKALLFLGAGSVIHAMSGEQDLRSMGGLKKYLPVTYFTFLMGTIAISGIPPFSGFFSKDEILAHAFEHNKVFWIIGLITSALTAFYMFRLFFLTFHGNFRGTEHQKNHLHESPKSITIPLIILAILSVIGGFVGIPHVIGEHLGHIPHALSNFLSPVFAMSDKKMLAPHLNETTEWILMGVAVIAAACSIAFAYSKYVKKQAVPVSEAQSLKPAHNLIYNKYYIDEVYETLITKPINWISGVSHKFVELRFIDAIVNSTGDAVNWSARTFRQVQTGNIGVYIFIMVISIVLILFFNRF